MRGRRAVLLKDLEGGPPEWNQPLKGSICVDLAGEIDGAFGTSFGTNRAGRLPPERFHAGASGPFDGTFAWGGIGNWNPRTWTWTYLGGFVDGWLEIDRAGLATGSPVAGRFRARVIKW